MMKHVYSVGQVNKYIKNMFAQDFMLHHISIKGEVSNCKYHSSGHIYFTMKDADGTINAIMFAGSRREGLKFPMKEGDRVVVTGSVEVYERDGRYQIYARTIERDGEGNLYLKFEALKRELEEMGMFAEEYKQPIPKYAKTVGIVTAETGAAIQDIRNIAGRRNPYVQLILCPALVQGEGAAASIVHGIHALEQIGVDVIIVGRGGGSIEDLWAFNEEMVARAIFDCRIPVISAVGHQTDFTIADYVADLRAPTPSAAAELAVFDYRQAMQELLGMRQQMDKELQRKVTVARNHLEHQRMRLHYLSPQQRMNENRRRVAEYEEKLTGRMEELLREHRHRLALLAGTLESYSPVKKLSGGYAFVEDGNHQALRSIHQIRKKDIVQIHLLDGTLTAAVTEIQAAEGVKNE
ncbi:exodeoxyribonuclease VII large subunit [Roseburia sp. TF10-5]|jgi:exodeoxyribonuclease VII large subunit|uniref:exodeoxyribonuclease VII large subunit n=1 Tax=Roseburia sp. TF10-5 TaxID=2293144 RepID=UPI000E4780CB|nr:exodeoxyribonuclease VII large subunit [Roseburia sp. TF10-5]RGI17608.1 exodeoxyribonuclease VII large subunit [Roseburia sp. TF10-5]